MGSYRTVNSLQAGFSPSMGNIGGPSSAIPRIPFFNAVQHRFRLCPDPCLLSEPSVVPLHRVRLCPHPRVLCELHLGAGFDIARFRAFYAKLPLRPSSTEFVFARFRAFYATPASGRPAPISTLPASVRFKRTIPSGHPALSSTLPASVPFRRTSPRLHIPFPGLLNLTTLLCNFSDQRNLL